MKYLLSLVQINHYPDRYKKTAEWLLKLFFSGFCLVFIAWKIDWASLSAMTWLPVHAFRQEMIGAALLLMPVNWLLEVKKWKLSVPTEQLSFGAALRAVLGGLALNWVVPFTLGDATSRLLNLRDKRKGMEAMLVNRAVALGLTGVFGLMAVLYYQGYLRGFSAHWLLGTAVMTGVAIGGLALRSGELLRHILLISLVRYVVFTLQFYLVLTAFLPGIPAEVVCLGIGWVFLFRSLIPSLFGNFGVREASALVFFEPYVSGTEQVLAPCLFIWLLNTVIPSVIGAGMIFKFKG